LDGVDGQNATHMRALPPDGKKLYTANILKVAVVNLDALAVAETPETGEHPDAMAWAAAAAGAPRA
jgi:hypothetical protein